MNKNFQLFPVLQTKPDPLNGLHLKQRAVTKVIKHFFSVTANQGSVL